jgi:hypothetical protein
MKKIILIGLVLISGLSACYYDNFEEINPGLGLACTDTAGAIGFTAKVLPIMNQSCGTGDNTCHQSGTSTGGYVLLSTKADVQTAINDGLYIESIRHDVGVKAMPKNGGKLSDCEIGVIEKWMATGMAD